MSAIKTVSEVTYLIKNILEEDEVLQSLYVEGEISNLKRHSSGHVYFTLKDEHAQLPAAWFSAPAFSFKDGDRVVAIGRINVYPPYGRYQLIVQSMQPRGRGLLYQQFLLIKERLQNEGLFDPQYKKPIPRMPRVIGVITSPTGAVIQDIIKTLQRRYPYAKLLLIPAIVQGEGAVPSLLKAFEWVELLVEIEVVILARGGGSFEDLWCFNAPELAYAIFKCTKPVVTAIGHETDTTIADMVADLRAPTPTAAAELVSRDKFEMQQTLTVLSQQIRKHIQNTLYYQYQQLDGFYDKLQMLIKARFKNEQHKVTRLRLELKAAATKPLQRQYLEITKLKEHFYRAWRHHKEKQKYRLEFLHQQLEKHIRQTLRYEFQELGNYYQELKSLLQMRSKEEVKKISFLHRQLYNIIIHRLQYQKLFLQKLRELLLGIIHQQLLSQKHRLALLQAAVEKYNVEFLLQNGFSLTLKEGKLIRDASTLQKNDQIETLLKGYSIISRVEKVENIGIFRFPSSPES
ncbi:MAG: exodeoxyribonuclease VII large subunit [Bacteroidia bacterium]|nr:exodeoxyribonuclease VII large subunit [Bacteroidia bacterium]